MSWVVEGVTVASGSVEYGTTPAYGGATPTKAETAEYTYTFNGWTPAIVAVTGPATYTATFTATPKEPENPDDPDEPYDGTETIDGVAWSYTVANGEATITGADPSDCDLVIPASVHGGIPVTVIGYEAFWCADITSVVIPNSVTNIDAEAFNDCSSLTNVVIGSGVVTIGGCVGQKTSIYDDPDEYIYTGAAPAFGACSSLMDFTLAEGNPVFEEIGGALYYRNTPSGAKTLALYPSGRSTLYFADGLTVTKIGDGACAWCQNFDALTIPDSVREIGAASFDFTWMTSVDIPNSVTNICDGAFRNSGELLAVEIPGSVKKIGNGAFFHGISLTTLVLDEGIETIGSRAFESCGYLNGEIVIPDGVTSIGRSAFSGAYEVDALSLPDTLTFIGADAFGYCESIQRLVVPLSVEEIEIAPTEDYVSGAFAYCPGLTEIYMPLSLKPATEVATQAYLAEVFEGLTTNNTDAERLAEILTWYSDYSEIEGGDEPTTYTITWLNWDGTTLETDENVSAGATPSYGGATPTRAESAYSTYIFNGWTPTIAAVTGNATYTATFTATPKVQGLVDLSTLTGAYTAQNGDILTGLTAYRVTIADGATITLADATIRNTLACAGSATIQIADGTANVVSQRAANDAGIRIGVTNTTLVINGDTGTLLVETTGGDSPAIGNVGYDGGDIIINGGVITAIGYGGYSPGIGGGSGSGPGSDRPWDSTCGDITINGGTIIATGGSQGAAIGGNGWYGLTGDITIGADITRLVATMGYMYAPTSGCPINGGQQVIIADSLRQTYSHGGKTLTLVPMSAAELTWMVVDLRTGEKSYYGYDFDTATNTFNTTEFKTTKMAFRRVPKGEYAIRSGTKTATMAKDYYIGIFEVTEAQYALMLDPTADISAASLSAKGSVTWTGLRGTDVVTEQGCVSNDVSPYAIYRLNQVTGLDFDLPTFAMWSVASRAKDAGDTATATWKWFFGPTDADLDEYAWNANNYGSGVHEVGLLKPNEWGLYDVYGNVWEWCADGVGSTNMDDYAGIEMDWQWSQTPNYEVRDFVNRRCAGGSACELREYCNSDKVNTAYKDALGYAYIGFRLSLIVGDAGGDEPEPAVLPESVTTGGNAEWTVEEDGSWRSGAISDNQSTWVETTVTGSCIVTFQWKTSSEYGYDMLTLYVDGVEMDSISDVMDDWMEYSIPISDNRSHTIRWTYSKDGSELAGEDCGWVKGFTVTPKEFASYTITWKNWDGSVLEVDSVVEGTRPEYGGATPTWPTDEDYYYVFTGWTPSVVSVTGDAIYTATYEAYQARFEMIMSGTTVTGYNGLVPKHITLADWPEGVTAVGDDALTYLHDLESIEIPATVETIGTRAFYNTGYSHLTNVTFEAGGTAPLTIGFAAFYGAAIESITFPARLAAIRDSAFYLCSHLETVTFLGDAEDVVINDDAFKNTPYYAHLPFKMKLMIIDGMQKVVGYQGTLPEVITAADWPAEATAVAGGALGYNSIVKDLTIPATITQIDTQAFLRNYELTNVVFQAAAAGDDPAPLVIKNHAFDECYNLRSVTFREGLSEIEGYAFDGCTLLAEINFPESGTEGVVIADAAFAGTEYESHLPFKFYVDEMNIITGFRGTCPAKLGGADGYPWPEGVDCIGSDAFNGCTTLEHVTLPAGIVSVALCAFKDCRNLTTVNFANSFSTLASIGGEAFSGCTSLETVELDGDGLYVDASAFEGCSSLTTLTFGSGVSQVDEYAFAYTTSLEAFVDNSSADIDETAFVGSGYYNDMPFSFIVKHQYGEMVIAGYKGSPTQINAEAWPAGVAYVNRKAFTFCPSLRAIEFPAHIEYIDEGAFACCTNLVSITFPEESELYVAHNAFALCTKLQNVTLKSGMDIDEDVFAGCASLETVVVEEGMGMIGAGAFARTLVRSIVLPEGIHWVWNDCFAGNDGDFTLYIPRNADDGNYGVSDDTVVYKYIPRIFGLETEDGWARYGLVVRETTTNLRVVPYCRVTLDLAGGTGVATNMIGSGTTVGTQLPTPTRSGYTFAGWTSARVASIDAQTAWTAITGSATGMDAAITATWTPGAEPPQPETPTIVFDDEKVEDPVLQEDGTRVFEAQDGVTLTQEDVEEVSFKSPIDTTVDITEAYDIKLDTANNQIVATLAKPKLADVPQVDDDADDPSGFLDDVDDIDVGKIAAMPEPDVSDPDPEKREEVGALPVKMYPGLYYQASWGNDLNNLTPGEKFQANGTQTHIGVIKQTGSRCFYKISVSEE